MNPVNLLLTPSFADKDVTRPDAQHPMTVTIVYEDQLCRDHAIDTCDRVLSQHWQEFDVECNWWRFMYLWHPQICQDAASIASQSDLVLFSVHANTEPCEVVKRWVDLWIAKRGGRPGALIALIGLSPGPREGRSPMESYLGAVAARAGMDFFMQTFDSSKESSNMSAPGLSQRALTVTPLLEDILKHREPAPRWGINE
jgi:hypothetical protein